MAKIGTVCDNFKVVMFMDEFNKANIPYTLREFTKRTVMFTCESEQAIIKPIVDKVTQYFIDQAIPKNEITQEEIVDLIRTRGLTFEKLVDAIVDVNSIIGVGLVTLGQSFYIYTILNPKLRRPGITKEEVNSIMNDYIKKYKDHDQN